MWETIKDLNPGQDVAITIRAVLQAYINKVSRLRGAMDEKLIVEASEVVEEIEL